MSLWAIVPVKPLNKGKSRLAEILSPDRRVLLNTTMFTRTIRVLKAVPEIKQIIVVSRDSSVLSLARNFNVKTIQEEGIIELNKAISRAAAIAKAYQATSIIIIPSDLPLLEAEDISAFLKHKKNGSEIIVAPDRRNEGTNGLYVSPPDLIQFKFGINSFNLHIDQAKQKNINVSIHESVPFGLDIDIPQDLEALKNTQKNTILEELMLEDLIFPVSNDNDPEVIKKGA